MQTNRFTAVSGPCNQNMRPLFRHGTGRFAVGIAAQGNRQDRLGIGIHGGLQNFLHCNHYRAFVGDFKTNGIFPRNRCLDTHGTGLHTGLNILCAGRDRSNRYARVGLDFVAGNHRARRYPGNRGADIKTF